MNGITSETPLETVLQRYPAARVVLSRYGLETYGERVPRANPSGALPKAGALLYSASSRNWGESSTSPCRSRRLRASSRCSRLTSGWTNISCCTRRRCSPETSPWRWISSRRSRRVRGGTSGSRKSCSCPCTSAPGVSRAGRHQVLHKRAQQDARYPGRLHANSASSHRGKAGSGKAGDH